MPQVLNIAVDGIAYGMILFVTAVGLTVTLGLMRFVNLAHGAFAMIGGYIAAGLISLNATFFAAVIGGVLGVAVVGILLERLVFRHLYDKGELKQVMFTIGLCFVCIASINAIAGPDVRILKLPSWLAQPVDLGFRTLPSQRLFVIVAGITILAVLLAVTQWTRYGVWLRAAVDDRATASTLGLPIRKIYAVTFGVGCGLAGFGGILGAEILPLEPFYPVKYLVVVLVVVAVGGAGSIVGTAIAALGLGVIETGSKYLASEWASVLFFAAAATALVFRPHGIMGPQK
ncbi:branched-chain amino acid ABC transporter permease [Bradyrhizobium sp. 14AA]